jgi:predicted dehydrogenase
MRAQNYRKTSWRTPASDPARERALNWRLDPAVSIGLAGELGTHQFDVAHWFVGAYPTEARGSGSIRLHDDGREMADTIQCDLAFPGGASLQYQASLANSFEGRYELFSGSNASIKLAWTAGWMFKEADAPTQGWEVYANRQQFHNDQGITLIADATQLASQGKLKEGVGLPNPPLYYAVGDFLKSVMEGEPVSCPIDEGARATIVGIQTHRAVSTNAVVPTGVG